MGSKDYYRQGQLHALGPQVKDAITVTLSPDEASELLNIASNGYGDGDFYGLNGPVKNRPIGWRKNLRDYTTARNKIGAALARGERGKG